MTDNLARHQNRFSINGKQFHTEWPSLTGREFISMMDLSPASDFQIVQRKDLGTQAIGLDERVDLSPDVSCEFNVFKSDRLFRAILNEREIVWGDEEISAMELRAIGEVSDDLDLFLDSAGDRLIEDDEVVRLKREGTERIRSREPRDQEVVIILNGEEVKVSKGRITFSELAKLAFPELFGRDLICFTVSFSRGPKRRREGVLLEGDKVRVIERMVFNVTPTDKS